LIRKVFNNLWACIVGASYMAPISCYFASKEQQEIIFWLGISFGFLSVLFIKVLSRLRKS
jgi:hypothetical protein